MNISEIKIFFTNYNSFNYPTFKYTQFLLQNSIYPTDLKNCSMNISEIKIFFKNYNSFNYLTFKYTQFQLQNSIYPTDLKNCSMNISEIKIFSENYNSYWFWLRVDNLEFGHINQVFFSFVYSSNFLDDQYVFVLSASRQFGISTH